MIWRIGHGVVRPARALSALLLAICMGCAAGPMPRDRPTDFDVIVIGGGMGGLSAATHLSVKGLKVLLLEQHHKVGGCTSSFSRDEFNFDVALEEMCGGGGDGLLNRLLREAGVYEKIDLIPIPELYRTIYPGLDFTCPGDLEGAVRAFSEKWPEEREGIEEFFELMGDIYEDLSELQEIYRKGSFAKFLTLALVPFRQNSLMLNYNKTLQQVMDERLKDPALKAALSQHWFFYGPPPSRLWAPVFLLANYAYLTDGAWHIRGSSQALANAYAERIVETGGEVRAGTRVTSIQVEEGRVVGVETEYGDRLRSRYVISSADPFQTFFRLLSEEDSPAEVREQISSMEPSNSFVGVYLGLDVMPGYFGITDHEVYYNTSFDTDAMYDAMMEGRFKEGLISMTFYGSLRDGFYAPPGKSVLVLHAYSRFEGWPTEREPYGWAKEDMAEALLDLAEKVLPDLREHIEVQETITPVTIQEFTMQQGGVPYGWNFTPEQWERLPNRTPIDGLYLAGSWTRPSHGVAGAQVSGHQAARLILDREGIE
ncbi:MAG: NAD(P)/FAD-dependent oxidoreductase [Planctomycetota bacterium]